MVKRLLTRFIKKNPIKVIIKMETQKIIVCRLCLKICDGFKVIEDVVKDILDIFLPEIDLAAAQEPAMCTNCEEMLIKCFDFKMSCFKTHADIVPFVNNENTTKVDLINVYLSKSKNANSVDEDCVICGFCTNIVKNDSAIPLDVEGEHVMLKDMIDQCLPELDISVFKKPVICVPCRGFLENCHRFVTNCLTVEERIKEYCETQNINCKDQIVLSNLIQFTIKDVITSEIEVKPVNIKVETQFSDASKSADERHDIENAKGVVEYETESLKEESNNSGVTKIEEIFFVEKDVKNVLVKEEIETGTDASDIHRLEEGDIVAEQDALDKLRGRWEFLIPKLKGDQSKGNIKDALTNRNVLEPTVYKCEYCSFRTKYEFCLKIHSRLHNYSAQESEESKYQCDTCSYQTIRKNEFRKHLRFHEKKVTQYKCDSCVYQTNSKPNLRRHLLFHKDPSEVTMHKCDSCSFQTKYKRSLISHVLTHNYSSQIEMYKCNFCSFQTKYKSSLRRHALVHKDSSEATIYKCDFCPLETRYEQCLIEHLSICKGRSAVYSNKAVRDLNLRTYSAKRKKI